jgi:hypothetical protein
MPITKPMTMGAHPFFIGCQKSGEAAFRFTQKASQSSRRARRETK